jgi:hypothetical protein
LNVKLDGEAVNGGGAGVTVRLTLMIHEFVEPDEYTSTVAA